MTDELVKLYLKQHPEELYKCTDDSTNILMIACDPELLRSYEETVLMSLCYMMKYRICDFIQILIDEGLNVNDVNNDLESALIIAASSSQKNRFDVIELLIKNGANIKNPTQNLANLFPIRTAKVFLFTRTSVAISRKLLMAIRTVLKKPICKPTINADIVYIPVSR